MEKDTKLQNKPIKREKKTRFSEDFSVALVAGTNEENARLHIADHGSRMSEENDPNRKFSYTGYEIMSDVKHIPEVPQDEKASLLRIQAYTDACKYFRTTPISLLTKQMSNLEITLRNYNIGPRGARAVALGLLNNDTCTSLNLEDTGIGSLGAAAIAEMLHENSVIADLNISSDQIENEGMSAITSMMQVNHTLTALDLSGNKLQDRDAKLVAIIIESNMTLRELILHHNEIGEKGGYLIAQAVAQNDTLRILDISWNHLRGKGSMSLAASLQKNIGLRKLDVSWNGVSTNDCYILGKALKNNTTLKELDISSNRLNTKAVGRLMEGIHGNDGLEILRLGGNPISPDVALVILTAIDQSKTCRIRHLDLSHVEVTEEFISYLEEMVTSTSLLVNYGHVINKVSSKSTETDGIDGNLDAVNELFRYMHLNNYRVIDLMKWLDKDRNMSVSRKEFKIGMATAQVPLTEHQLDMLLDRLDRDKDGEVDFAELMMGERDFRRRMRRKQERRRSTMMRAQDLNKVVLAYINENT